MASGRLAAATAAVLVVAVAFLAPLRAGAETGHAAWLRYAPIHNAAARRAYDALPDAVVELGNSQTVGAAQQEIIRGVRGMLGRTLRAESRLPRESAIVIGTLQSVKAALPGIQLPASLPRDGYLLESAQTHGLRYILITGSNHRGVLYGAFALLRKISLRQPVAGLNEQHSPAAPVRWVNDWDNLNGSIERGYGGSSIFFENGQVAQDLSRAGDYARLLASVGINGCAVNNVNADPRVISDDFLPQLVRIAAVFRPWGVRLAVSVDLSSPQVMGGLNTFDPLDPRVAKWWQEKFNQIYHLIPDFGGVVMKADSEGRLGPSVYGRTPADAANMIARALRPHGGIILYRAFVYNHHLDWRNLKNDRARAAYDIFHPLDGKFDSNVVVQIKNGPIDFQVREPVSPLLGALRRTNEAIEFEITQEYTGQQRHLCFLAPMWRQVLQFDMQVNGPGTPVKSLVTGKTFNRPLDGFVGVSGVGRDATWLGSHLALANLYAFGRLAWNPDNSSSQIAREWTRQTFGNNPRVVETITAMQMHSWRIYEDYTGSLGIGTLTDILGSHYGPGIESAERNGWGQWIRAGRSAVGMDRTVATGTGYIGQYSPALAGMYENLATCPDALLLFMHHVPYTYKLHSGKTVIQTIYDMHYEGAQKAAELVAQWRSLRPWIDEHRYQAVLQRLEYQAGHAIVWRDAVCSWFLRMSGIADAAGRAGHFPSRVEAEDMKLQGYQVVDVHPWETASGGKAVGCPVQAGCSARFTYHGKPGWCALSVQYFDQMNGVSRFTLFVNQQIVDEWQADAHLPARTMNGSSSTRRTVTGLALRPGDQIRIQGIPDGGEPAPLDYVSLDGCNP